MEQHPSKPGPGAQLRVIGAGLPGTGTASLSQALENLLHGPVYHGSSQICHGLPSSVQSWIEVFERTPIRSAGDRTFVLGAILEILQGYVAAADIPLSLFVPELMRLYPDAMVICTIPETDDWAKSCDDYLQKSMPWYVRLSLYPLSPMGSFPHYLDVVQAGRWNELYQQTGKQHLSAKCIWEAHVAYLKKVVPPGKLFFVNISDGWEPLCRALECDVPVDTPFPLIDDGAAIDEFARGVLVSGFLRWICIFAVVAVLVGIWLKAH